MCDFGSHHHVPAERGGRLGGFGYCPWPRPLNAGVRHFMRALIQKRHGEIATVNLHAAGLDPDTLVICSDVVDMVSEYRVYVTKGEIIGCKQYWGDFRKFPDFSVIDQAIATFKDHPAWYAIDFAVTQTGVTMLIEINDGFAIGCYGLNSMLYSGLLEARWEQLVEPLLAEEAKT
ncbi:hypothetical protein CCP4SC76_6160002 [Gammaproteobacteria bacterium]